MFDHRFVEDYISAVRGRSYRSPIVPVGDFERSFQLASLGDFLGYSIVPADAEGNLAASGAETKFVAMPHVFRRTKDGCGDRIDKVLARNAGLSAEGLGGYQNRGEEAKRRLEQMIRVYGLP